MPGLARDLLAAERPVHLGGVEEPYPTVDGVADEPDGGVAVDRRTVGVDDVHHAHPEGGDLEVTETAGGVLADGHELFSLMLRRCSGNVRVTYA